MGFSETLSQYDSLDMAAYLDAVKPADVERVLAQHSLTPQDYLTLLSPAAEGMLEAMAQKANDISLRHFGKTIQLFTPLYLANYCTNQCVYCGFNTANKIQRTQLSAAELKVEAEAIAATGLKHILILTGDAPAKSTVEYIGSCATLLSEYFSSISIEVYAMTQDEYAYLIDRGVDGLTIYQETYNKDLYEELHPKGPKRDYAFRLDAPERGCEAGMRTVNVGALLGLESVWQRDAFYTGLHAEYLQRKYPGTSIAISLPRMRPHVGAYEPASIVTDRNLVQLMLAQRIFLRSVGITVSTREPAALRDNLMPLGVTKMSAGVTTAVGGHTSDDSSTEQFEISDPRSVEEMCRAIEAKGFQPVFKDWEPF
ncbi:2-iminoacetate synthase ThiH [Halodesulfovibrio spirochaetisodalis]|uniref:Thiamine biosynthesis protein ThiH n=1 Tax=Halodesulfovibrio spirochaetisodalis TaxID=1560234 RepID=A0A1B7XPU7_9BACT|nr:2-iminoacetate synthase ThiH [Halodesulfovibrio spirochaetisodalis]OBQ57523.1 thiamine biosynthesis protein ThiH [Halodesulfovibrio spirochaetisodalis]